MRWVLGVVGVAALAWTAGSMTAQTMLPNDAPVGPSGYVSDVNGNGIVDAIDMLIVSQDFGTLTTPQPCIEYDMPPFDRVLHGTSGEPFTPTGGVFVITGGDARREALRLGTPVSLRAC